MILVPLLLVSCVSSVPTERSPVTVERSAATPTPVVTLTPAAVSPPPARAAATGTRAAFALTQSDDPRLSDLLLHPGIDGVALQLGWSTLEPAQGRYEWAPLDRAIDLAKASAKQLTLHVLPTLSPPPWLAAAGVQLYSFTDFNGRQRTAPIPWDTPYLTAFGQFVAALSEHVAKRDAIGLLFNVSVAAPESEMSLVACRNGILAPGTAVRYDRAAYLAAWKRVIDVFAASLPASVHKYISAPVSVICGPERDATFYPEVIDYAVGTYGASFWAFAADLRVGGSERMRPYLDSARRSGLAYQMIWSASNDPSGRLRGTYPTNLRDAVCQGIADGAGAIEVYAVDVLSSDPTIEDAIVAIHDATRCPSR